MQGSIASALTKASSLARRSVLSYRKGVPPALIGRSKAAMAVASVPDRSVKVSDERRLHRKANPKQKLQSRPKSQTSIKTDNPRKQLSVEAAPLIRDAQAELQATQVARPANITDGRWDGQDQAALVQSSRDPAESGASQALLGLSNPELEGIAVAAGLQKFRGQQIFRSLLNGARTVQDLRPPADAVQLPKDSLAKLSAMGYRTGRSIVRQVVQAPDGTCKFLLQLFDGRIIETVGIPDLQDTRLTVCVSSQVGCAMRCTFCATGKGGFARNLLAHEIVDQVLAVQEHFKRRVSNIVFMGMGEPMLNGKQVTAATRFLIEHVGIGARHITISTVGVPNSIAKLAAHNLQITLAVSLHACSQELRERLVPSARMYPIVALLMDCQQYFQTTGRRVTFEYILLAGVNDSVSQAQSLAKLLQKHVRGSHVNLIPYNAVDDAEFQRPSRNAVMRFSKALSDAGVGNTVRVTRGSEAAAACGQLRNTFQKTPLPEFSTLQ